MRILFMMNPLRLLVAAFLCGASALSVAPAARAEDAVSLDFFYTNLQDKGDWLQTPEYGYVFQPRVAQQKRDWRPYSNGSWAHTDEGWLWNSREDFGWATYHYGRWTRLKGYNWVWVPGYEWAPAWVAFRGSREDGPSAGRPAAGRRRSDSSTQVSYVGWAPLPPEARFDGSVGFNSAVDYDYDIAPDDYCFVETRYFGEPYLGASIIAPLAAYGFWGSTYGYTNITYTDYGWGRGVYVGGPRYEYVSAYSTRPIVQYQVQRNIAFENGGVNNFKPAQPSNGMIPVFAPKISAPTAGGAASIKPANVKAIVPAGQVQRGWNTTKAKPEAVAQAKEHLKTQAASASPAKPPTAEQRAAGTSAAKTGAKPGAPPAKAAAVPNNAGRPNNALVPNTAPVPRNQLSPENAARVQAAQTAKGAAPNKAAARNATGPNQLRPENAARVQAAQAAKGAAPNKPAAKNATGAEKKAVAPAPTKPSTTVAPAAKKTSASRGSNVPATGVAKPKAQTKPASTTVEKKAPARSRNQAPAERRTPLPATVRPARAPAAASQPKARAESRPQSAPRPPAAPKAAAAAPKPAPVPKAAAPKPEGKPKGKPASNAPPEKQS